MGFGLEARTARNRFPTSSGFDKDSDEPGAGSRARENGNVANTIRYRSDGGFGVYFV